MLEDLSGRIGIPMLETNREGILKMVMTFFYGLRMGFIDKSLAGACNCCNSVGVWGERTYECCS